MRKAKGDRNYLGVAIVIFFSFIMATAVIGYIFGDNPERVVKYNDYKFTATDQGWALRNNGRTYYFSFTPPDLEHLSLPDSIALQNVYEIDVTYDFNSSEKEQIAQSLFELKRILDNRGVYLRQGFTTNTTFNLPILTCQDSTPYVPVIYYRLANETSIVHDGSCIILESPDYGNSFLQLSDLLAYRILGIM